MKVTSTNMLANVLRGQRRNKKLSQSETAKSVGIKQTTISSFENTPLGTKLTTLFKLLAALNLELSVSERGSEDAGSANQWKEERGMVTMKLTVAMNGIIVGTLCKLKGGTITFDYDKSWLALAGARAISLSLPLQNKTLEGDVVYNFFDNLLPDNDEVKARIQRRFSAKTKQPFDLLAKVGGDCVGTIQLYPQDSIPANVQQINATPLTKPQVTTILKGYQYGAPLGMLEDNDDFRISIAGAQEKTGLLWYQNQWHLPLGSTPTSHIMKLPIGILPHHNIDLSESCENEWLCLRITKAYGLPVCNAQISHFGDIKALVVERFDRRWSEDGSWLMRLPQEDMCQALGFGAANKYESDGGPGITPIMDFLYGSQQAVTDREVFFKSQILFWLLAATDGHAKNFSAFLQKGNHYRLTPLYDIMSMYPLLNPNFAKQKAKIAMALWANRRIIAGPEFNQDTFTTPPKESVFLRKK